MPCVFSSIYWPTTSETYWDAGDAEGPSALVAGPPARESDQDRGEGRQSRAYFTLQRSRSPYRDTSSSISCPRSRGQRPSARRNDIGSRNPCFSARKKRRES